MKNNIEWLPAGKILINDNIKAQIHMYDVTVNPAPKLTYADNSEFATIKIVGMHGRLRIHTDYPANEQEDIVDDILTDTINKLKIFDINLELEHYMYNDTMKHWEFKYKLL